MKSQLGWIFLQDPKNSTHKGKDCFSFFPHHIKIKNSVHQKSVKADYRVGLHV